MADITPSQWIASVDWTKEKKGSKNWKKLMDLNEQMDTDLQNSSRRYATDRAEITPAYMRGIRQSNMEPIKKVTPPSTVTAKPPAPPAAPKKTGLTTAEKIAEIAPYVSNIANSFRRAPNPAVPKSYNPVTFQKVNFDADAAEIDRQVTGANMAGRYMNENTEAAYRTGNLIQGIRGKNQLAQMEQNMNAQIGNSAAALNTQIEQGNVNNWNAYQDARVNRNMINQTMQSANLSNAADKFVASQNQRELMELEGTKYKVLSELYRPSGVLERFTQDFQIDPKTGVPMYKQTGKYGGRMKFTAGGMMKVYGDGGKIADPPGLTRGLIAKPRYNFDVLLQNPSASDTAAYNVYYNSMRKGDPHARYNHALLQNTPLALGEKEPYINSSNMLNAYDDALNPNVMSKEQVMAELNRPLVLPPDVKKKKAFGGWMDEPPVKRPVSTMGTNSYVGQNMYSRTMEADRTGDAMVLSPQTAQYAATQLNMAPRPAQTAEAARSGDYFAPPAPRHQYVSVKGKVLPAGQNVQNYMASITKNRLGGRMRKVF